MKPSDEVMNHNLEITMKGIEEIAVILKNIKPNVLVMLGSAMDESKPQLSWGEALVAMITILRLASDAALSLAVGDVEESKTMINSARALLNGL